MVCDHNYVFGRRSLEKTRSKKSKKKLKALYIGDTRKVDKVAMFFILMTTIEQQVNEVQLAKAPYAISICHKMSADYIGKETPSDYDIIVCSWSIYRDNKDVLDTAAISRAVIVLANEEVANIAPGIATVSIKDGVIKQISGDMFLIPSA